MQHTSVLLNEAIKFLDPKPGEFFIDGTFGAGGHAREILNKIGSDGRLLAIDFDEAMFQRHMIHDPRLMIQVGNYADLPQILEQKKLGKADGLLLDLGFSSEQLASGRGFSFSARGGRAADEPLLMTYNPNKKPVKQILRELNQKELTAIIKTYGEERYASQIAKAIKERSRKEKIETTGQLVETIMKAVPANYEHGRRHGGASRIHPATRTFMALRIYANRELENLEMLLKNLHRILKFGGRAAIISFHSLEDRLVKNYFRDYAKAGNADILTKKTITATEEEIRQNPRSRSAKLRAAILKPNT